MCKKRRLQRLYHRQPRRAYRFEEDNLNLVASAEHTLAPYHMNEVVDGESLPLRYIGYSTAFRRLEYKTQVFVNHEGDYYRTRLTHTMEVAQISRCVARVLNLNEDLAEAIALAHDLGHTPFGHSGEEALSELMRDHGGFEHNLHGLRVVDVLEKRYPGFPGLNLSWELRESVAKHNASASTISEFNPEQNSLLEAQVVEKADSIAYDNHDLDDGLTSGLLKESDLQELPIWDVITRRISGSYEKLTPEKRKYLIPKWANQY